jgi:hypothetical protein
VVPNWPTCPIRVAPRLKSAPKGEKWGSVAVFVAEWSCEHPAAGPQPDTVPVLRLRIFRTVMCDSATPRSARSELIFRGELPAAASRLIQRSVNCWSRVDGDSTVKEDRPEGVSRWQIVDVPHAYHCLTSIASTCMLSLEPPSSAAFTVKA